MSEPIEVWSHIVTAKLAFSYFGFSIIFISPHQKPAAEMLVLKKKKKWISFLFFHTKKDPKCWVFFIIPHSKKQHLVYLECSVALMK